MTKIFFDTEFTGLYQDTKLISIGCISEDGNTFYAELIEEHWLPGVQGYGFQWLNKNVISNLHYNDKKSFIDVFENGAGETKGVKMKGNLDQVQRHLNKWLGQYKEVEMWSDCLAYDWVLFDNIWGHSFSKPNNVYYIPFDICTLFKVKGIDPDINREEFCGVSKLLEKDKHNALFDAEVIKSCYERLMSE